MDLWQLDHRLREGPFEMNDMFAIINVVPAISPLSYGFFNKGFVPALCFGAVSSDINFPNLTYIKILLVLFFKSVSILSGKCVDYLLCKA